MRQEWKRRIITGILIVHLAHPAGAAQQAPPTPPPAPPAPAAQQPAQEVPIALHLENADLLQVIGIIAAELQMNYVVDPRVQGTVHINTLGQLRREDLFPLLQMILRTNGATAVQAGNFYRIVPLQDVQRMPIAPQLTPAPESLPADDRLVMNVIPLRYVTAADMTRILTPFLSEGGHLLSHDAGNILLITDSSRSMTRLLEIVSLFDTEAFTNQRARLYPVRNSQATQIVAELQNIFAAYALSRENSAVRFVAFERINSVLVVTPNASVYPEVERWLERLDQPVQESGIRNFIYRVEYGSAEALASVLNQLLLGTGPLFLTTPGRAPASGAAAGAAATPGAPATPQPTVPPAPGLIPTGAAAAAPGGGLSSIRIVPDPINNFLVIQATAQQYEQIRLMLRDLDVVPRQVMIEAKVYEVDLSGALSAGVSAFLQRRTADGLDGRGTGQFGAAAGGVALTATMGTLVGKMRELVLLLSASESRGEARVISAPSLLATDNLPASIRVGAEVPILSSQVFGLAAQTANNPVFTNTIQNRDTGVLLTITPRVNSSGLVTLQIQQEVSAPLAPEAGAAIQSPSISKRSVSTQAVVQDGQTIALGGIIQESRTLSRNRIPLLGDIPYVGALFGNTSLATQRTELILLLTPTVIRDSTEARNATAELRSKLRDLRRILEQEERREQERREVSGAR